MSFAISVNVSAVDASRSTFSIASCSFISFFICSLFPESHSSITGLSMSYSGLSSAHPMFSRSTSRHPILAFSSLAFFSAFSKRSFSSSAMSPDLARIHPAACLHPLLHRRNPSQLPERSHILVIRRQHRKRPFRAIFNIQVKIRIESERRIK